MHDGRVEFILAHSDPLDVANAIESVVGELSWETFYEVAGRGRSRLAGSYRNELNEVLALEPPVVREEFSKFLRRNPRTIPSFGAPFISGIAARLEDASPPLFGESRRHDRARKFMYVGAIAAAFVLGVAITVLVTRSRAPIQAAAPRPISAALVHLTTPAYTRYAASSRFHRRVADEVAHDLSASSMPAQKVTQYDLQLAQPQAVAPIRYISHRQKPGPPPNGKGDAIVALPAPTATPEAQALDAESDTPVWRKGTVNVQAAPAQAPSVQDDGVPHEARAIPIQTATPIPPPAKGTPKPGLLRRAFEVLKAPASSPTTPP